MLHLPLLIYRLDALDEERGGKTPHQQSGEQGVNRYGSPISYASVY
jgi:hypothetical protein